MNDRNPQQQESACAGAVEVPSDRDGRWRSGMETATMRRVDFSNVGENWWKFLIDASEPFQVLVWLAKHMSGPWSSRMPSTDEVRARVGFLPEDQFFLMLAFQEEADAELFALWRADPGGNA
jgi:hypothetical protein